MSKDHQLSDTEMLDYLELCIDKDKQKASGGKVILTLTFTISNNASIRDYLSSQILNNCLTFTEIK